MEERNGTGAATCFARAAQVEAVDVPAAGSWADRAAREGGTSAIHRSTRGSKLHSPDTRAPPGNNCERWPPLGPRTLETS
jgi:hypothetical protein